MAHAERGVRLFVGAFLTQPNQSFYDHFVARLVATEPGVLRPIPSRSVHLTCVFCADVPDPFVDEFNEAARAVAAGQHSFLIGVVAPQVLLAGRTPRLVSADIADGHASLDRMTASLVESLVTRCPGLDLRPTRSPHLTLARFRRQATREDAERVTGLLERVGGAEMRREERVSRLQVIESTLTSAQPIYKVRLDAPFLDAGPDIV